MSLNGLTFSLLHQTPQGTTLPERAFDFVAGTSVANVVDALTAGISGDVLTISFLYKTGFQNNGYGWHGMTLFDKNNMAPSIGGFTLIANTANYDLTYATTDHENVFMNFNGMEFSAGTSFSLRIELIPTDIMMAGNSVSEDTAGAVVGALTVVDLNDDDTHTLVVDDARFEVVDGSLKLKDGVALDFDDGSSVDVTVTAEDSFGLKYKETLTIDVTDVVETFVATKANKRVDGTAGADILCGRQHKDVLNGRGGDDILQSTAGNDRFRGGAGADTFIFGTRSDRDVIVDFETGIDKIDVSSWEIMESFRDLKHHAHNHGQDLWIEGGRGDVLIIKHFSKTELSVDDFIF